MAILIQNWEFSLAFGVQNTFCQTSTADYNFIWSIFTLPNIYSGSSSTLEGCDKQAKRDTISISTLN
jgi:hypothetical protein